MTVSVDAIGSVIAAFDFDLLVQEFAFNVNGDFLRVDARLHVSDSKLTIDVEAPCVEVTVFGKGCRVAESCRAGDNSLLLAAFFVNDGNPGR